jgi:hypothetical protein
MLEKPACPPPEAAMCGFVNIISELIMSVKIA